MDFKINKNDLTSKKEFNVKKEVVNNGGHTRKMLLLYEWKKSL